MTEFLYEFLGLVITVGMSILLFFLITFGFPSLVTSKKKNLSQRELQKLDLETKAKAKEEYLDALQAWEHLNFMTDGGTGGKRSERIRLADAEVKRDFYHNQAIIVGVDLIV